MQYLYEMAVRRNHGTARQLACSDLISQQHLLIHLASLKHAVFSDSPVSTLILSLLYSVSFSHRYGGISARSNRSKLPRNTTG